MDPTTALAANPSVAHGADRGLLPDGRRSARDEQRQVELARLMAHQRIGADLLSCNERQKLLLDAAKCEVKRWADLRLCSQDYIDRWSEWLLLPPVELVARMCSDADGWGMAMRQNSPFGLLHAAVSPQRRSTDAT